MTITPEPSPPPKTRLRHLEHCLWPALLAVGLVMTWITRDPALAITSTLFAAIGFLVALILKHGEAERLAEWNAREFALADRQFSDLLSAADAIVDADDRTRPQRKAIWALRHAIFGFRAFEIAAAARPTEDPR